MTNLSEELHVSPRQRITVPEGHTAIVIPTKIACEVYNLCSLLRKVNRLQVDNGIKSVAGDVMLALLATDATTVLFQGE